MGEIPYRADGFSPWQLRSKIREGAQPTWNKDSVPKELKSLVTMHEKCLSLEPTDRPTARQLRDELVGISNVLRKSGYKPPNEDHQGDEEQPPTLVSASSLTMLDGDVFVDCE